MKIVKDAVSSLGSCHFLKSEELNKRVDSEMKLLQDAGP
jgi:hypothetical protein